MCIHLYMRAYIHIHLIIKRIVWLRFECNFVLAKDTRTDPYGCYILYAKTSRNENRFLDVYILSINIEILYMT